MNSFTRRRWLCCIALSILPSLTGCVVTNAPLNDTRVPLADRKLNHTRAALFADLTALDDVSSSALPGPGIVATSRPAKQNALPDADTVPDGYFVGLALSGGGSRSANFSAAVMLQLQKLGLLQRVDYISSVSGGSLPGASYCVSDDAQWNPRDVERQMAHGYATDMILELITPWDLFALAFTRFSRSDLLADALRRELFTRGAHELTFGDLRRDRPRLLINATDLQSGKRFVFCNESFDQLNSDLSRYPLASAVAASASVPVLLHQVTLRDYSTAFEEYRHFIDGGVTDNLGVQTLVETYTAQNNAAKRAGLPVPYPHGAIFIVVDAGTHFQAPLSSRQEIGFLESLKTVTGLSSTVLLSRASSATLSDLIVRYSAATQSALELRKNIDTLSKTGFLETQDVQNRPVRILHISLEDVNGLGDLPFYGFGESLENIATYFNIDPTDAYHLYQAADLLMRERFDPIVRKLKTELDAQGDRH